jgi:hypothetical protein
MVEPLSGARSTPLGQGRRTGLPSAQYRGVAGRGERAGGLAHHPCGGGFRPDELEVSFEDGELTIRGKQIEEVAKDYIHRGIAARQFKRTFALANGVEVRKAELHNGLLAIELERPRKEKKVLKVGIVAAE